MADSGVSDMTSVADARSRKDKHTKRLKKGTRGLESTSKMDSSSNASGFMSRATKNKGIRRGDGKRSAALAAQNDKLLSLLQQQLSDFKAQSTEKFASLDTKIDESVTSLETRVTEFQENLARNSVQEIKE